MELYQKNVVYTNCENSIEYSDRYDIGEDDLLNCVKNVAFLFPMLILAEAVILCSESLSNVRRRNYIVSV